MSQPALLIDCHKIISTHGNHPRLAGRQKEIAQRLVQLRKSSRGEDQDPAEGPPIIRVELATVQIPQIEHRK